MGPPAPAVSRDGNRGPDTRGGRSVHEGRSELTPGRGGVVVDTDVYSARLVPGSVVAQRYEALVVGRPIFLCFQTVAEMRYGALLRNWGTDRVRGLETAINAARLVNSGTDLIRTYTQLRVACERQGHGLSQQDHDADRWIAATAVLLDLPLVSNDRIFEGAPGLDLLAARS